MIEAILDVVGVALLVIAAALIHPALGLAVAGAACLVASLAISRSRNG